MNPLWKPRLAAVHGVCPAVEQRHDGMTTVQAICDGEVIAEKIMAVNGGDWRVVEMELTIDQPGEHTLTVGTLTKTITIVE